jgi:hypothetical protein
MSQFQYEMLYVGWKERKEVAADLKAIYRMGY